jgi:glycosyltransferase involved in cell wall biosynthesis
MVALKVSEQKSYPHSSNLPLASIIITSYNYAQFLPRAIDSALQQTYPKKEIIVVDDGSTDNSRHVINSYGDQIIPVFKENGGWISATNAGFFASQGEIIFFLDADDIFFPPKVETMVNYFLQVMPQNPEVLIFHRLEMRAGDGISLPGYYMPRRLRTLDGKKKTGLFEKLTDPETAYRYMQKWGFFPFISSATSGISLTRSLAGKIFPLPEERAIPQDECLVYASMLLGTIYGTSQILGSYFIHEKGVNLSRARADSEIERYQIIENFLNDILEKMNKERIASFFESRQARAYYRRYGSTKDLIKLAWKIPGRCFCWETIRFSIQTLRYCLNSALGIKKRYWDTKKKLLAKAKETQAPDNFDTQ